MIVRLLKFLSVVYYFRSIPAKESRKGAENKRKQSSGNWCRNKTTKKDQEIYSDYVIDVIKFFSLTFVKSKHSCVENSLTVHN